MLRAAARLITGDKRREQRSVNDLSLLPAPGLAIPQQSVDVFL